MRRLERYEEKFEPRTGNAGVAILGGN